MSETTNKPRDASLLILTQMPWEDQTKRTIRLCVPGIHNGGAVWLETEVPAGDAQELLERIKDGLATIRICRD